ncbi:AMP-binding protein [Pseudomonas turukhanskensis]|uniref:Long-chain acyl-CoA synthetase n=1 Tax=Pseudomonas turukhanskensis TaxID=1806536 RepID=A0A9W6K2S4_9PSED|nr:AMP-binding protein [Pseudomonas turukhanskensis]GLK88485.1 long-chain acyl-CoA synthetase [Pseudomonas turukhanskensis]
MPHELAALREALQGHALQDRQGVALRGETSRYSYHDLWAQVEQRRALLEAHQGQVFALVMENSPEAVLWDLAALFAGLPCVTLPPFFTHAQRLHCFDQSQVDIAVADAAMAPGMREAGFYQEGAFWRRKANGDVRIPAGTAKITYTSGTTGTPKGVCLSAAALLRVTQELANASRSAAPEKYLAVLPLAVLLENLGIYAALWVGASVTVPSQKSMGIDGATGVDWARLLASVAMSGAHSLILVPQLLQGLVTALERKLLTVHQFRFVAVGGGRVSLDLLERAAKVNLPVYQGYGLSECASVVCLNQPEHNRLGSVGKPLPHVTVRLGEDGEVLVKGSALLGYLGDEPYQQTWLATGDIGEFDADGYLYLKGRKKHQFITSFGRNVNPDWVEAELTQRGTIAQAFVHGEGLNRNLALLWPLDPTASDETLAGTVAQANAQLPDYAQVHAWKRLPEPFSPANGLLTSNGRLRREAILSRYRDTLSELVSE